MALTWHQHQFLTYKLESDFVPARGLALQTLSKLIGMGLLVTDPPHRVTEAGRGALEEHVHELPIEAGLPGTPNAA
jgi:hypothetical protein